MQIRNNNYQVNDIGHQDSGDVAADVYEGQPLRPDHGGQQFSRVLHADVVRNVHGEAAHDRERC